MRNAATTLAIVALVSSSAIPARGAEAADTKGAPGRLDLPGETFQLEGQEAFVLLPAKPKRSNPQPWIMYAPTLGAVPDIHERWMHERFLDAGVAVAGINAGEAYGSPEGTRLMTALYTELVNQRKFSEKPCLFGRSRGGLWVSKWAIAHPEKTAGIIGIYPVFDLRSYPGLAKAAPAYGLTETELNATLTTHNPIARISQLAEAQIPICIIHGDDDKVVPHGVNSVALAEAYAQAGQRELVQLIIAKGQGHNHWDGFFRAPELVDFAVNRAKAGAAPIDPAATPAKQATTLPTTDSDASREN